jgi:hypothetical protein
MLVLKNGPLLLFHSISTDVSQKNHQKYSGRQEKGYKFFFVSALFEGIFLQSIYILSLFVCYSTNRKEQVLVLW